MRRFGFSVVEAGLVSGFVAALPASISIIGSGLLVDGWAATNRKGYAVLPAFGFVTAVPLLLMAMAQTKPALGIAFAGLALAIANAAIFYLWTAVHYWRAARYIEADIDRSIGLEV